jgi:glycosyltransferase involved in cell wall biosynthesis
MRPLKIALVSQFYWYENERHYEGEGGANRALAEAVAALGHEVVVLSQSSEVRRLKKIEIGKLETWVSPREKHRGIFTALRDRLAARIYSYPKAHSDARHLRDFLKKRGPFDVIWAHSEMPDGLAAALAAKQGGKLPPVVVQAQGLRCRFEKGATVFVDKKPLGLAFRQAERILAVSELVAANIPKYAGPGLSASDLQAKTHVVYPNLKRDYLAAAVERPTKPAPMKDRILFLGALNQQKGALVFLKALPKTELSKRSSSVAIIGGFTGPDKRFIKRWDLAREEARKVITGARVEYLGLVSTSEVIRQIKLSRAVIVPSLFDGYGRGLLEGLVVGRPVVTTDQVGSSPLVRAHQAGIVIAPNDSNALAHAIDAVLSPIVPFAEKAAQLGPQLAHDFSPEAIAKQIEKHLSEAAG